MKTSLAASPYRQQPARTRRGTTSRSCHRRPALTVIAVLLAHCLLSVTVGCSGHSTGPGFEAAPPPPENRGRVYLYRSDSRGSLATVKTTIDGRHPLVFHNHEYETFELSAGTHRIRAGMRGFAFLSLGWNDHQFRVRPGETVYVKLNVRIDGHSAAPPGPRELEIGGRAEASARENVFISQPKDEAALAELGGTTRLVAEK